MRHTTKLKRMLGALLAIVMVTAVVPVAVFAETQIFDDGFEASTSLDDLKANGWAFEDESVMSFDGEAITATVKPTDKLNKKYQFSYDLGEELFGEFYIEVDYSLGGTSAFGNQDFVFLSNGTTTSTDAFAKTYAIGATLFTANMDSYNCICGNGGTAKHATYNNFTVYDANAAKPVYAAQGGNNYVRLKQDKMTVRYYVNTEEGYFTTQLKKQDAASFAYPVQHTHKTTGENHLIQMPIRKNTDGSNRGFSTIVFQTPFKRPLDGEAWAVPEDTDPYIKIYDVRVEKFDTTTAVVTTESGEEIVNDSIIEKPESVNLTFSSPITLGFESIELYENDVKIPMPDCAWDETKTILTYSGENFKNSASYKIVITGANLSSGDYPVADGEIRFLTKHAELDVVKNSVLITDQDGVEIAEDALNGLVGGEGKSISVKVNAENVGDEKQGLTLIVLLCRDMDGYIVTEKVACDVVELENGVPDDLEVELDLPDEGVFDAKVYLWNSLGEMVPLNTYTELSE